MDPSYAHPEVLVTTQWVSEHLKDPHIRIAEVDYDPASNYNQGHIPGAVIFDWKKDMNDPVTRDILSKEQLEALMDGAVFRRILQSSSTGTSTTGSPPMHSGTSSTTS